MRVRTLVLVPTLLAALAAPSLAGFAGTDVFLPMAGRQKGVFPSDWYTTVWIYNPSADSVTATLYLLVRNTADPSPPSVQLTIPAGGTEKLDNVVESYFHQQVFGALRVTSPAKLVVTSRVYSKGATSGEKESVGQDFSGVPASFAIGAGETTRILGAHQTEPSADSDYRYNFGFVETTGHPASVTVTAFDENGAMLGSTPALQVREYSQRQLAFKDYFPSVSAENLRLEVAVTSGTGRIIAYGSGIANGSQDPTTFEMDYRDSLLGMANIQHDATLKGDGTTGAPLGIAEGGIGADQLPAQIITSEKLADAGVTVHKLATVPSPLPPPGSLEVSALRDDPLEQFFKMGDWMFWAPAFTGDITAVYTDPGSGLAGGMTWADAHLAIADGGVTTPRLADMSVSPQKLDANPPGGDFGLKLTWSSATGMEWQTDLDDVWPKGVVWGSSSSPIYSITNTLANTAIEGIAATGTGLSGRTTSGTGVRGTAAGGVAVRGDATSDFSPVGVGVLGTNTNGDGVRGESASGSGVHGRNTGNSGAAATFEITEGRNLSAAVEASTSGAGAAVLGKSSNATYQGYLGRTGQAVYGDGYHHVGYLGSSQYGAYGLDEPTGNWGLLGSADFGAYGANAQQTVYGYLNNGVNGAGGRSGDNWGRLGTPSYGGEFNGSVRVSTLAGTGNRAVYSTPSGVLTNSSSDKRLKRDVTPLTAAVDVVASLAHLRGVTFNWDASVERAKDLGGQREIGMIAQEVEAVLPELVGTGADGYKTLDYAKLTAFLIEVAKAQQAEIAAQRTDIKDLRARLERLEATP